MKRRNVSLFLTATMMAQLFSPLLVIAPAHAAPAPAAQTAPVAPAAQAESDAIAVPKGATYVATVEGISEYRLDNGLRVLLFPDESVQNVTVNITYLVGSRHESYGETGMAHLLEHMLFKGSKNHRNITQELSEHGANSNATTWLDRTNYFETVEATEANLTWALEMEADRMVNSFVAKKDLDTEMTVVRNEFESGENDPGSILFERALEAAFIWHNYGNPTIGARSDIENVPIDHLQAFYRTYYQPDNAVLVVAGRFDPSRTLQTVTRLFGAIPRPTRILPQHYTREPAQDGEREVTLRRVGDVQDIATVYHLPAGAHPDFPALDVLVQILGDAPGGRLYKALIDTKKATSVSASTLQLHDPGIAFFSTEMRAGTPLDPARKALLETVEEGVRSTPITAEETERAKNAILKQIELSLNSSERVGKELSEWQAMGDWRLLFIYRDALRKVTAADCQRVAEQYFRPSNRTLAIFVPSKSTDRVAIPEKPDVNALVSSYKGSAGVAKGERFEASPENIEKRTLRVALPSGIKLNLLSKKTRGASVRVTLTLRFGTLASLRGKAAVGEVTSAMLMRGTTRRNRQEIKDTLDRLKARVSIGGTATGVTVGIETVRENLPEVLRLTTEMLREPSFPQAEFEQLRQEALAELEQGRSDPETLAPNLLRRHMNPYPSDDVRYIATLEEDIQALHKITLEDVKAFHKAFYGASDADGAAVGDFDAETLPKLLGDLLGDWKSPSAYARVPSELFQVTPIEKVLETPDKENALYVAGLGVAMTSDDPDYAAMVLANYMLGGGFLNSRLATRLRQQLGVSYGTGSSFSAEALDKVGRFGVYAIYAPQNAEKVRTAIREVLETALKDGFTEAEVQAAITGLLQSRQVERAKDASLLARLAYYCHIGRTMAWDIALERTIRALTPAQVLSAMRRHIDVQKINVVTAGDFKGKAGPGK